MNPSTALLTAAVCINLLWQAFAAEQGDDERPPLSDEKTCCPSKWLAYEGSCYYFARERKNYTDADYYCKKYESRLIVFTDKYEMKYFMREHALWNTPSWIGLRGPSDQISRAADAKEPSPLDADKPDKPKVGHWVTQDGMDPEDVKWLVPLYPHGVTTFFACTAYYNPGVAIAPFYVHAYPCNFLNYFVCESNPKAVDTPADYYTKPGEGGKKKPTEHKEGNGNGGEDPDAQEIADTVVDGVAEAVAAPVNIVGDILSNSLGGGRRRR